MLKTRAIHERDAWVSSIRFYALILLVHGVFEGSLSGQGIGGLIVQARYGTNMQAPEPGSEGVKRCQARVLPSFMPQLRQRLAVGVYLQLFDVVFQGHFRRRRQRGDLRLESGLVAHGQTELGNAPAAGIHQDRADPCVMGGIALDTGSIAPGAGPSRGREIGIQGHDQGIATGKVVLRLLAVVSAQPGRTLAHTFRHPPGIPRLRQGKKRPAMTQRGPRECAINRLVKHTRLFVA